ncbi:ribosylnicotinamide kinase [Dinochytrium kinnereticum]|nr:ribosylnicotinamide kinase [Dinochytrium kinnereticum]
MSHRVVLVGIGGASCSGKSTLANWLSTILKAPIIHQDQFYKTDAEVPVHDGIQDWDCPEALDMKGFVEKLQEVKLSGAIESILGQNRSSINTSDLPSHLIETLRAKANSLPPNVKLVLVDGFLLYDAVSLYSELQLRLFLHASFDTLRDRRQARTGYVTLEGFWQDPPNYFQEFVWPRYQRYNAEILKRISSVPRSVVESQDEQIMAVRGIAMENELEIYAVDTDALKIADMVSIAVDYIMKTVHQPHTDRK